MASIINLKDKKGIILGIANDKSIAWGIADQLNQLGAQLAFSYVNESIKKRVIPLAQSCNSEMVFECDVKNDESIDNFFSEISKKWSSIDFVVHSKLFQSGSRVLRDSFMTIRPRVARSRKQSRKQGRKQRPHKRRRGKETT